MIAVAEQTEGVHLAELLTALQPDPRAVEAALSEILHTAAELEPDDGASATKTLIEQLEPVITPLVTASVSRQTPPPEIAELLDELAGQQEWSALAAVLRRILAGERDEPTLLTGLDEIGTPIVRETLSRIAREE